MSHEDMFMGAAVDSWTFSPRGLPSFPGEHVEDIVLDMTSKDGRVVEVTGRATVIRGPGGQSGVVYIEAAGSLSIMDRYAASAMLRNAVEQRLTGSDVIKGAVKLGYRVKGLKKPKQTVQMWMPVEPEIERARR